MMIRIAHRGNYKGRDIFRENTISYIEEAIANDFDVEVDVWLLDRKWYLGHDLPKEEIDLSFLERSQIWTHAKDLQGYVSLYHNPKAHVFWHDKDDFVFTSKGIKWARSGIVTHDGVMTMPQYDEFFDISNGILQPLGICCDDFRPYHDSI